MTIGQHITPTIKLVRKLDEGGMGTVWAAENLALGSLVAVKMLFDLIVDLQAANVLSA